MSPDEWEKRLKERVVRAQQAYTRSKGKNETVAKELEVSMALFSNLICRFQEPPEPYYEPAFESVDR